MQTTLLSLAFAAILALVAALIGPHFVDWSQYRHVIEARASDALGTPVRVRGTVDLRLLPIPWISAESVEIGGDAALRARALTVEFAFGPMLRGEWRVTELRLSGPDAALTLDAGGRLGGVPSLPGISPDNLFFERLVIEDGRLVLVDGASGMRNTFEKITFTGDLRSIAGPLRGEGRFLAGATPMGYRVNLGRAADEGARLRFVAEAPEALVTIDTEGAVRLVDGVPRFEGGVTITRGQPRARPEAPPHARLTAKVRASPSGAAFEQIDLHYGSDERPARFSGTADLKVGASPRLDAVLSARQVDLDAVLFAPETRRPIEALAELLNGAPRFPIPVHVSFGLDAVGLARGQVTAVRGEAEARDGVIVLQRLDMRAPGLSQLRLSGELRADASGLLFTGPATLDTSDAKTLLAWLSGRPDTQAAAAAGVVRASGRLTLGEDRFALEGLKADIDRRALEGRVAFTRANQDTASRLEASLRSADVDADALIDSFNKVLAGASEGLPGEVVLDLDFAKATLFGVSASGLAAQVRYDAAGLAVERLAVADLGGARLAAHGRIAQLRDRPHGAMTVDLDARELDGVTAALSAWSPAAAARVKSVAARLTPAKLRLNLNLARSGGGAQVPTATLDVEGRSGVLRIGVIADASGMVSALQPSDWKVDARIDADDGTVLAALLGLDAAVTVDRRAAWLRLVASGIAAGASRIEARLAAGGLDATARGSLVLGKDQPLSGAVDVDIVAANANRVRHPREAGPPLPVSIKGRVSVDGSSFAMDSLNAVVAGQAVRGKIEGALDPTHLTGHLEANYVDAAALIATALGLPAAVPARAGWSSEPFAPRWGGVTGDIDLKAAQVRLAPALVAREAAATLRLRPDAFTIENVSGTLDDGRLSGEGSFQHSREGANVRGRFALREAKAQFGLGGDKPPRFDGLLTVVGEIEAAGLSPATLVGSLKGTGAATLEKGALVGLDARIFDRVMRAAEQGLPLDTQRVADFVTTALDRGRLGMPTAEAVLTVSAGQIRLAPLALKAEGIDVAVSGQMNLADGETDARVILTGPSPSDMPAVPGPEISVVLKGPTGRATRTVDVTGLVAFLTLRSMDRQARRIEAIEKSEREKDRPPAEPPPPATPGAPAQRSGVDLPTGAIEAAPALPPPIEIPGPAKRDGAALPARSLPRPPGAIDTRPLRSGETPARLPNRAVYERVPSLDR